MSNKKKKFFILIIILCLASCEKQHSQLLLPDLNQETISYKKTIEKLNTLRNKVDNL